MGQDIIQPMAAVAKIISIILTMLNSRLNIVVDIEDESERGHLLKLGLKNTPVPFW